MPFQQNRTFCPSPHSINRFVEQWAAILETKVWVGSSKVGFNAPLLATGTEVAFGLEHHRYLVGKWHPTCFMKIINMRLNQPLTGADYPYETQPETNL